MPQLQYNNQYYSATSGRLGEQRPIVCEQINIWWVIRADSQRGSAGLTITHAKQAWVVYFSINLSKSQCILLLLMLFKNSNRVNRYLEFIHRLLTSFQFENHEPVKSRPMLVNGRVLSALSNQIEAPSYGRVFQYEWAYYTFTNSYEVEKALPKCQIEEWKNVSGLALLQRNSVLHSSYKEILSCFNCKL